MSVLPDPVQFMSAKGELILLPSPRGPRPGEDWTEKVARDQLWGRYQKITPISGPALLRLENRIWEVLSQGGPVADFRACSALAGPGGALGTGFECDVTGKPLFGRLLTTEAKECDFPTVRRFSSHEDRRFESCGSVRQGYLRTIEVVVACRKCPSCLALRQRQWAARARREALSAKAGVMVTLTVASGFFRRVRDGYQARRAVEKAKGRGQGKRYLAPWKRLTDRQRKALELAALSQHVARFRKNLRDRSVGQPLDLRYIRAFEYGERYGRLHCHMLLLGGVPPQDVIVSAWAYPATKRRRMKMRDVNGWLRPMDGEKTRCGVQAIGFVKFSAHGVIAVDKHGNLTKPAMAAVRYVTTYATKAGCRLSASLYFGKPEKLALHRMKRREAAELKKSLGLGARAEFDARVVENTLRHMKQLALWPIGPPP